MSFDAITNWGEFFSNHYLDSVIASDVKALRKQWELDEAAGVLTARRRLRTAGNKYFEARAAAVEATGQRRPQAVAALNATVLEILGFEPHTQTRDFKRNTIDLVTLEVSATAETDSGLAVVALDAGLAVSVDELFEAEAATDPAASAQAPALLLTPGMRQSDNKAIWTAVEGVSELFATDEPPRYVLVVAGTVVLLAERAKWAEGRYLAVDLDAALERNDLRAAGELETVAALFSAEALVPGQGEAAAAIENMIEESYKHAIGVSQELRRGLRMSVELLANEVIGQLDANAREGKTKLFTRSDVDPAELTRQCLRYLYRLLVLLYAESRPELGIVPADDEAYADGYSLDRLRELCLVELDTDRARHGSHFHESLSLLFELTNKGYHADAAQQQLDLIAPTGGSLHQPEDSREDYLQFPGLDATLFDPSSTPYLNDITLRNETLQRVLRSLMVATGNKATDSASFISYAQLGINQLGAVYEGLMAYSGFFADQPLFEVARNGDPSDGTWMLPVGDADQYPDEVFVTETDEITGLDHRILHEQGSFVYRLAGRDRQRSASYYTPEVLTQSVVHHALAELLGLDDYAPPGGAANISRATDLLDLTVCEPALGSGAFLNEAINQLAAEYLKRAQTERGESLDADRYRRELQKVKAHFALNQSYGVDLNGTAVELAEVSLWLNCMHPGLKAPWFGLQLRQGNSLIGCRRATWSASQLKAQPWRHTGKSKVQPPVDRPLAEPLGADEIHHFLLPDHGWAAVADRKEAKELRPDRAAGLREWRKQILGAPGPADSARLAALAEGVEDLWAAASERVRLIQRGVRRFVDVYGVDGQPQQSAISRDRAEAALADPDSPLGRLRALMDAWVGLWFWPLDTDARLPTWAQWLDATEALVRPQEAAGRRGQLDLFDDLDALLAAEQGGTQHQSVAEIEAAHPWLAVARDAARQEGVWHWELEWAPAFAAGGFDLQVGNPPWVRPRWEDDLVLAEHDPWWGVTDKAPARVKADRRAADLASPSAARDYLAELASAQGVVEFLGSAQLWPALAGTQVNLYMGFMVTTWRHLNDRGTVGLIHPESHFTDPKAGALRRATYGHLRRHWQFVNAVKVFEDVGHTTLFGLHISGRTAPIRFLQQSSLFVPHTAELSLAHDGSGELPAIQLPGGGWDLRPHQARVIEVTESVLADWAALFDDPGTPAAEARLLRPVTTADLAVLRLLATHPTRLADQDYHWTRGWEETAAKADGTIEWDTQIPPTWDQVILQGPHFALATPFNKQPNENCRSKGDYSRWDLETLPARVIPRTNYQRACRPGEYTKRMPHWDGRPANQFWRLTWRRMTQPGSERSLQAALVIPGPLHVHTVSSMSLTDNSLTTGLVGLWSSLPFDYLMKVSGKPDVQVELIQRFPAFDPDHPLAPELLLRTLRLNALTEDYAPLWAELFAPAWTSDGWTNPDLTRSSLNHIGPVWTMDTPLRRDQDRWQALVEIDALAAVMLGLDAEQLCAMYRSQFAVLRKYEYRMVFDAEGRKIAANHQTAGYRQAELQDQAKAGDRSKEWKKLWNMYEAYTDDPASVDWGGHFRSPFVPADREAAMTRAHQEFTRRLAAR